MVVIYVRIPDESGAEEVIGGNTPPLEAPLEAPLQAGTIEFPETQSIFTETTTVNTDFPVLVKHARPLSLSYPKTPPGFNVLDGAVISCNVTVQPNGQAKAHCGSSTHIHRFFLERCRESIERAKWSPAVDESDTPTAEELVVRFVR